MSLGYFPGSVTLPVSLLNQFASYIKTTVTGFILLEFLIDLYRRLHKKGEIIE